MIAAMEFLRKGSSSICVLLGGIHQISLRCDSFSIEKMANELGIRADLSCNLRGSSNQKLDLQEFVESIEEIEGIQILDDGIRKKFLDYVARMGKAPCRLSLTVRDKTYSWPVRPDIGDGRLTFEIKELSLAG